MDTVQPFIRDGEHVIEVFNSGLEAWVYDDAHREAIRASGAMAFGTEGADEAYADISCRGLLLGYSLMQDDALRVGVVVGEPLTDEELAAAAWLEPQRALLDLPSGRLAIESNDASRIGPESPTETGALVDVPAGRYRVTLYRIDHEALDREGRDWSGPEEVIVLTPGGLEADATDSLLPWEPRRDTDWVGGFEIAGNRADALVWFGDCWDTCLVNLDGPALVDLGAEPGRHLRVTTPDAALSLLIAVGPSWDEARRIGWPAGPRPDEYGYGAVQPMADWDGAEALFCRREHATRRVEDAHQNVWLRAEVELLPASAPRASEERVGTGPRPGRALADQSFFDRHFLPIVLSDVLPGADDEDELPLAAAVERLDARMEALGFSAAGDRAHSTPFRNMPFESTCRYYLGDPQTYGVVRGADASIEVVFVSRLEPGTWIVTGLADNLDTVSSAGGGIPADVQLTNIDEEVGAMLDAHRELLEEAGEPIAAAPTSVEVAARDFDEVLRAIYR